MPWLSFGLLNGLLGIGVVSGGTPALNEVMERDVDAQMRRTALRPLPTGRMSLLHASLAGVSDCGWCGVLGGLHESVDWLADVFDIGGIPRRIYAAKTGVPDLHLCWRVSWRDTGSSGMDCGAGTTRVGNAGVIRDLVLVAVPAFLFNCMAVP